MIRTVSAAETEFDASPNYALVSRSRDLPASVADLRETGQTFAALPAVAGRLNDSSGIDQVIGLNCTISRLATLDPAQGQQGATVALREVLEGGGTGDSFNSLRYPADKLREWIESKVA